MASPHTAGLLAYLLSIYPSEAFDPSITEDFVPLSLDNAQSAFLSSPSSIYAVVHASLPRWISGLLPSSKIFDAVTAPAPKRPKTLSPPQLKKALLALSTKGALTELPEETPNLLLFNNATTA